MLDIICAGQAVLDVITRGREDQPYRPNVYRAQSITLHTGGDAVNESMALAGMGLSVAAVCGLGHDLAGNIISDALKKAAVDTSRIARISTATPIASLQVALDGSRYSINSSATRLPGFRIDPGTIRGARVVSLASLFRPPLEDPESVMSLIHSAHREGAILCADTKLPLVEGVGPHAIRDALPLIDYIFPNEREAAYYTGQRSLPDMAKALSDMGIRNVVIKAGADGCYIHGRGISTSIPAIPVKDVVDTTGAGDNFVAGFIHGLLKGESFEQCADMGLHQAAHVIASAGGTVTPESVRQGDA